MDITFSRFRVGKIRPCTDFRTVDFKPGLSSVHVEHNVFGRFVVYLFEIVRESGRPSECKCRKAHAQCEQKSDYHAFLVHNFAFYHVSSCVPYFSRRNVFAFKKFSLAKQEKRGTPCMKIYFTLYTHRRFSPLLYFFQCLISIYYKCSFIHYVDIICLTYGFFRAILCTICII